MAVLPDPFPARDRIVDKSGYPTEVFVKYFEGQEQGLQAAASNIGQALTPSGNTSTATTEIATSKIGNGVYRLSFYMEVVTPAGASSDLTITFAWTSSGVAKTKTSATMNGNTATTFLDGSLTIHADGDSPITYSTVYNSNPAAAAIFGVWVTLERIA
jgi:hypothetical protein